MIALYYSPGACSLAAHILLAEAGAPYELRPTLIAEGATQSAEFLRLNPKGRVPVLVEGDFVLTELPAICHFIARRYPSARLWPVDPQLSARTLEWFNWLSSSVHAVAFAQLWRPHRFVDDASLHEAVARKGRQNVLEAFAMIEERLAGRQWALGDAYSAVDAFLLVLYRWGNRIGEPMGQDRPAWTLHTQRMFERQAATRAFEEEGITLR